MDQKKLKTRAEIPEANKWHLEDVFSDNNQWEAEYSHVEKLLEEGKKFEGHLADNADMLISCFEWMDDLSLRIEEVYAYARMRRDEDNRIANYQALTDRAGALAVKVSSAASFVVPELLAMPEGKLKEFRATSTKMELYNHVLDDILRKKEHILSSVEERLLAEVGELAEAPGAIFSMANNADLRFPNIVDESGQEIELTKGNFIQFMESQQQEVRKAAFKTLYGTYEKQRNTWAATLNSSIKSDVFFAKARHYPSALEASLDDDRVPLKVYDSLINTVHEFLPHMHRYIQLRKKALKLSELHMYDIYVPIVPETTMKITYEEAKNMVIEGLRPLGEEYISILEEGFSKSWIDVYENEGKTSGAYSWGTYRAHPYVLLNHQDTLDSMFTLAHEMGHSLHTYLSNRKQPHIYAGYKIFVAEVASTLNESLIMEHLLKKTTDPKILAYLVNHYLEQFRGTIFRQTMFAEFEKKVHLVVEQGGALTADNLSEMYRDLNSVYYGKDVVLDPEIALEWARIPHFYNAFYVYKYATGFSAAIAFARAILEEGQPAVTRYLEFLSGGSSDYPIELLRKAGVDMETPAPVGNALQVFAELVDQLEKLLK
ncbi:oligoendopeptidase F [Desulfosporosinus nitroreducens]|uniref:Oligopeptidase F n=1 Tax=Desulfosporosinus nitroreducens TaxID=2018668 RepID=A0ABT8QKV9_9FIRM|nr:oligoendopeptidase F [Desulfosporosinus nitroreducens]MCO1600434.1 oligoendopeptidase F [Desulfosporosinus nitroreducens]MDO0821522.1 oligoendopeptidase F [Desulfosporosinus nitroreducens]